MFRTYFPRMIHQLSPDIILNDPYVRAVGHVCAREGAFALSQEHYEAMELFVCDDF